MKVNNSHIIYTAAQDIHEICKPLTKHLNIPHFGYTKLFSDGSEVSLSTLPDMIKNYFDEELHQYGTFDCHPENYTTGFLLWSQFDTHPKIASAREKFQVDHGITYVHKLDDAVEFFHFATTPQHKQLIHSYLNNLDLLETFSTYFNHKASGIIASAEKTKFIIPRPFIQPSLPDLSVLNSKNHYQEFLNDVANARSASKTQAEFIAAFTEGNNNVLSRIGCTPLTFREAQCLYYLSLGYITKTIASELSLSPRTIEHRIDSIKLKMNVRTRTELVAKTIHVLQ